MALGFEVSGLGAEGWEVYAFTGLKSKVFSHQESLGFVVIARPGTHAPTVYLLKDLISRSGNFDGRIRKSTAMLEVSRWSCSRYCGTDYWDDHPATNKPGQEANGPMQAKTPFLPQYVSPVRMLRTCECMSICVHRCILMIMCLCL